MRFTEKKRQEISEHCSDDDGDVNGNVIPISYEMEDFLVRTRRILLVGVIDEALSTNTCNYLQVMSVNKNPIYMYINSPGGCLSSGYAIIDQMLSCDCPVYTIVRGQAYSMAAVITAFGAKNHRYAMPNSSLMLHSVIIQNSPDYMEQCLKMIVYQQEDYENKISQLAKRLKVNQKKLKEIMEQTVWMPPIHAIRMGVIDGIWTPKMEQTVNKGLKG